MATAGLFVPVPGEAEDLDLAALRAELDAALATPVLPDTALAVNLDR